MYSYAKHSPILETGHEYDTIQRVEKAMGVARIRLVDINFTSVGLRET
jgi:hypothetical protein